MPILAQGAAESPNMFGMLLPFLLMFAVIWFLIIRPQQKRQKTHQKMVQEVKKGDVIGLTGQTGLAGGDHLHYGVFVNGIFVNPIEWWDGHWIKDNITRKLALLE